MFLHFIYSRLFFFLSPDELSVSFSFFPSFTFPRRVSGAAARRGVLEKVTGVRPAPVRKAYGTVRAKWPAKNGHVLENATAVPQSAVLHLPSSSPSSPRQV